jgi:hypothetical protein
MRPALILLLSAAVASAAGGAPRERCATAERHDLDFVIGNWLVRDSSGQAAGTATFARAHAGCVLVETWFGVGSIGESLGIIGFDPESGRWQRTFLGPGGVVLSFAGRKEGPTMVMTGLEYRPEGVRLHRLTWRPRHDGTVEQRWQVSTDDGRSWQVSFRGVFHRIAE